MKKTSKLNQKGFTVVEMMVAVGISTVIAGGLFAAMRLGDQQAATAQVKMTIQDSAREGLYKMMQELRTSSPTRITITGNGNTVQFRIPDSANPVGADFKINWNGSQLIQYTLGGAGNRQIVRTNTTTGQQTIMANDVASINFAGNAANPTVVTLTIGVQRALANGRTVPVTPLSMAAQAEIRNS